MASIFNLIDGRARVMYLNARNLGSRITKVTSDAKKVFSSEKLRVKSVGYVYVIDLK